MKTESYLIIALPSKRAIGFNPNSARSVAGPFPKAEAQQFAKEQRELRVYGRVFLEVSK